MVECNVSMKHKSNCNVLSFMAIFFLKCSQKFYYLNQDNLQAKYKIPKEIILVKNQSEKSSKPLGVNSPPNIKKKKKQKTLQV